VSTEFAVGQDLDRYQLQRQLGEGAFGEVWLASEDGALGMKRKVALKIITAVTDERVVKSLLHEARLCGYLSHPNILSVHGVVQLPEAHFIIMEFIDGEDLAHLWRDMCALGLRFPRSVLLDIGIAIGSALDHAWNARDPDGTDLKIVHRDMKPHNVMVSRQGQVKVADFGIAKAAPDVTLTATGILKGTPTYLAPEIWAGSRDLGPPVDLFSLGIILWEMAVGQRFFGKVPISTVMDLLASRTGAEEAALVRPALPQLESIVARLLARDPSQRPQRAIELVNELKDLREKVDAPGTVEDFITLANRARVAPDEGGTARLPFPSLVGDLGDWTPLVDATLRHPDVLPATAKGRVSRTKSDRNTGARAPRTSASPRANGTVWAIWLGVVPAAAALLFLLLRARGYL
jgi:serine/threonine protein kinase